MSHTNVSKAMSGADVNSEGKPYHEHGDNTEKHKHVKHPQVEHPEVKDHLPHGHNNQFHKDIKGSVGSGATEGGDRKVDKEST